MTLQKCFFPVAVGLAFRAPGRKAAFVALTFEVLRAPVLVGFLLGLWPGGS